AGGAPRSASAHAVRRSRPGSRSREEAPRSFRPTRHPRNRAVPGDSCSEAYCSRRVEGDVCPHVTPDLRSLRNHVAGGGDTPVMRVNRPRYPAAPGRSAAPSSAGPAARGRRAPAEHRTRLHGSRTLRRLGRVDRWAFDRVAAARLPGLEYVLPRLSRFADHGVLWFTTAGALGTVGGARLRRAALSGSIAIAVASPAVHVLGKPALRRRRPVVDLVPPIRIRWKLPTSHAFPSGHSASAAAFATGVAMEAPRAVAVPVAATAAAVAFSRVYTGAHYPGDVLAGIGVGALAAL